MWWIYLICGVVTVPPLLGLLIRFIVMKRCWGRCTNTVQLDGKIAIVTGANSGIGYEICKELALRGATVVLACRNMDAARGAIQRIHQEIKGLVPKRPPPKLVAVHLDLANLNSIAACTQHIIRTFRRIHLIINNAGVSYPARLFCRTDDGYEAQFGINHLGHFYFTNLLLMDHHQRQNFVQTEDRLRIVIVSSKLHEKGVISLMDDNIIIDAMENHNFYADSKLANVYFGRELAQRNSHIDVYTVCPGWVWTQIFRHYGFKWYQYLVLLPIALLYMRTPKEGAQTAIFCATESRNLLKSGEIYRDCKLYKSTIQFDDEIGEKLWEKSWKMIRSVQK